MRFTVLLANGFTHFRGSSTGTTAKLGNERGEHMRDEQAERFFTTTQDSSSHRDRRMKSQGHALLSGVGAVGRKTALERSKRRTWNRETHALEWGSFYFQNQGLTRAAQVSTAAVITGSHANSVSFWKVSSEQTIAVTLIKSSNLPGTVIDYKCEDRKKLGSWEASRRHYFY
jgi:hypothetical protein